MVNEIVPQGHVFVILEGYYYRMVNVHKRRRKAEHRETRKTKKVNLALNDIDQFSLTQTSTFSGEYGRH